jgi:hypothetical protein
VCSIGGNVAENSGGAHCFKYGFTANYVTGLEVVLRDGDVVQLGGNDERIELPGLGHLPMSHDPRVIGAIDRQRLACGANQCRRESCHRQRRQSSAPLPNG